MALDPKKLQALVTEEARKTTMAPGHSADGDDDEDDVADGVENAEEGGADEMDVPDAVAKAAEQIDSGDVPEEIAQLVGDADEDNVDGGAAPAWAADPDLWDEIVVFVDPVGEGADDYDDPWLVVAVAYDLMGGALGDAGEDLDADGEAAPEGGEAPQAPAAE